MHPYISFLTSKLNDRSVKERARAMAAISLHHQRASFELPNFMSEQREGTAPGTGKKISLCAPLASDNAWAGIIWPLMANPRAIDRPLQIAESLMALQAPNGGIYISSKENMEAGLVPVGDISFAHTIDVHKAFRFLFEFTRNKDLHKANQRIVDLFKTQAFNPELGIFNAGGKCPDFDEKFIATTKYATDVQWGVLLEFGPSFVDQVNGADGSFRLWESCKKLAGRFDGSGNLTGFGLVADDGAHNAHAESTMDGILVAQALAVFYPEHREKLLRDAGNLMKGAQDFVVYENGQLIGLREALVAQLTWWGEYLSPEIDVEATARALVST